MEKWETEFNYLMDKTEPKFVELFYTTQVGYEFPELEIFTLQMLN